MMKNELITIENGDTFELIEGKYVFFLVYEANFPRNFVNTKTPEKPKNDNMDVEKVNFIFF